MNLLRLQYWQRISRLRSDIAQVSVVGYLVLLATFLQQLIAARLLGPEQFGRFAATAAVVGLIEVALVGRSSDLAMRYLGTSSRAVSGVNARDIRRILIVSDARALILGYLLLVGSAGGASLLSAMDWQLFAMLGLTIPSQIGYGVNKCSLFMLSSMKPLGNFELVYTLIATGLNAVGIIVAGLYGYVISLVFCALLKNALAYAFLKREWQRDPTQAIFATGNADVGNATVCAPPSLGRDGLISMVRNLLINALSQVDIIILSWFMPAQAVGYYKVGKSLAGLPTKIAFPLWRFINPKLMSGLRSGQADIVRSAIQAGSIVLLPVTAVVIGVAFVWGRPIIAALYGSHFQPAYASFVILLVGASVLNGFGGWLSIWTVSIGAQRFSIYVYATTMVAQLVLGLTLGSTSIGAMAIITTACMCGAYVGFYVRALRA